jgi:hypothetical protein
MELIACYQRAMEADKKVDVAPSARAHLARRWLIELIGVLVLTGCIGGVYLWSMYRQGAIERQCETILGTLRAEADAVEDDLVSGRAEGVFRAYSAGIHAAVLASRKESLELSVEELVRLPGVAFIHLFHPDGSVIASSDRKLVVMGKVGERGVWALGAQGFVSRKGDMAGTLEMAMPLEDAAGVKTVLWMSYETGLIKARTHKARLPASP